MKLLNTKLIFSLLIIFIITVVFVKKFNGVSDKIERKVIAVPISNCNPQKTICKMKLDKLNMEVSFDKNIFYLKPFNISIKTDKKEHIDIDFIQIDFKMKGMDMGLNRFKLRKASSEDNKQVWRGTALLPVCVTRRADWYSELEVVTKESKYVFTFPIVVKQAAN